jgi:hypothetical protein
MLVEGIDRFVVELMNPVCNQNSGWRPGFFHDKYQEQSRLLRLDLRLISIETDPRVLERSPDPSRPSITFEGTIRGFNSDKVFNRPVCGTVHAMGDGNIRWSFVSLLCAPRTSEVTV